MFTLDVGCGDRPRGTVNLDLLIERDFFKKRKINLKQIPNFVKGTIYYLPFRDSTFQTVYCFDLVEHLASPVQAIKELTRVSFDMVKIKVLNGVYERGHNFFFKKRGAWTRTQHLHFFSYQDLYCLAKEVCAHSLTLSFTHKIFDAKRHLGKARYHLPDLIKVFFPPFPTCLVMVLRLKPDACIHR